MSEEIPKQRPFMSPVKKTTNNVTVIEVEKDVPFLLNSKNGNLVTPVSPVDKNSTIIRKTYSKKHPIAFNPCVSFSDDSISVIGPSSSGRGKRPNGKASTKPVDLPESSTKIKPGRKRLSDSNLVNDCPIHKKRGKRSLVSGSSLGKVNGTLGIDKPGSSRELRSGREGTPDSDIEIIEIVGPSTSRASYDAFKKSQNGDISRKKRQMATVLKPSSFTNDDVLINEADTAPNIPSDMPGFSENEPNSSFQSSTKWLSADGTLAFSALSNGSCSSSSPVAKANDKFHLYMPEIKTPQNDPAPQKKNRGKRELNGLFKNLNEISWAHEKSFKQLLAANTDNRHSERITAKVTGGKNLRRPSADALTKKAPNKPKHGQTHKNSAKLALKRAKHGSLKQKLKVRTVQKQKVSLNNANKLSKATVRPRKMIFKIRKPNKARVSLKSAQKGKKGNIVKKSSVKSVVVKDKNIVIKKEKDEPTVESNNARVKNNSATARIKGEKKIKPVTKPNVKKSIEQSVVLNPVLETSTSAQPVNKPLKSILKKPMLKVHFKEAEPKNGLKNKLASVNKEKSSVTSIASSSKTWNYFNETVQNSAGNCSYSTDDSNGLFSAFEKNFFRSDSFSEYRNSSFVKEVQSYDNEVQIIKPSNNSDKALETAVKKGSKLRVSVEPLEHTKLWNSDFFESFKRHVLEQAFLQTLERRDHEFINTMFQELEEACFQPPNNLKSLKKKKSSEEEVLRSSVRQIGRGYGYKEIFVKKMDHYLQFVLLPHACKLNSLNIEAIKELKEAFIQAKKDPSCRAVLLNSSGTYFCTGIELSLLVGGNRKQAADEMASAIKDLVLTLSTFTKPIVAAVNGTAVGLGVALLTYCDVVLASDKATFCIPATRLGYLPEGGITLTLPQVVGSGVATEMLLYGRRLTAEQALRHGLISEVLWPTQLMNEVVPRMETICSQPLQVMEATKTMVRCHLWDKLKTHMERECRLLPPLWLDAQCQHNIKRTLATGWLVD